jgi:streptomycin 6-kinase
VTDRLAFHANNWGVAVDRVMETHSSWIAYGRRESTAVVLKVVKHSGDEWRSGDVVEAFGGRGMVRLFEHTDGALLLERLDPGKSLVDTALRDDAAATEVLARVIGELTPRRIPAGCASVSMWGEAFARYAASGDSRIPTPLLERARETFMALNASQRDPRLLHGDLQHSNVLFDRQRGWLAIDPKGVVGELEYEIGAALRNPHEAPARFTDRATIERRLEHYVSALRLDRDRTLAWAFSQAVLSIVWSIEDGEPVSATDPAMALATTLASMLPLSRNCSAPELDSRGCGA